MFLKRSSRVRKPREYHFLTVSGPAPHTFENKSITSVLSSFEFNLTNDPVSNISPIYKNFINKNKNDKIVLPINYKNNLSFKNKFKLIN